MRALGNIVAFVAGFGLAYLLHLSFFAGLIFSVVFVAAYAGISELLFRKRTKRRDLPPG